MVIDRAIQQRMRRIPLSFEDTNKNNENFTEADKEEVGNFEKFPVFGEKTDEEEGITEDNLSDYISNEMGNMEMTDTSLTNFEELFSRQVLDMVSNKSTELKSVFAINIIAAIGFSLTTFDLVKWLFTGQYNFHIIFDLGVIFSSGGLILSTLLALNKFDKGS